MGPVGELFATTYGRGVSQGLGRELTSRYGPPVVITQPEPWASLEAGFGSEPAVVVMVEGLERAYLDLLVRDLPAGPVLGVGGGSAMDAAKWVSWNRGAPLWQVPSLPSVNAAFTHMVAVRDETGVHYSGDAVPEMVFVDFDLMREAPAHLLRGGIGDVFTCHTARWDWEYAVARGHQPAWDEHAAAESVRIVAELHELAPEIRKRTDEGIQGLMEQHRLIGKMCDDYGHARFEEGSEHFFAYCFEFVNRHTIMHGELGSLGVLIMSALQGNRPELAREIVQRAGVRHTPEELGITWAEIEAALRELPDFVRREKLWYSVANDLVVGQRELGLAREAIAF
jgi:glycerol dehydrogenase-like iron-containing ADH family enzyme